MPNSPSSTRRAGGYARSLARMAAVRLIGDWMVAIGATLYLLHTLQLSPLGSAHPMLSGLLALLAVIALVRASLDKRAYARASVGGHNEARVAKVLNTLGAGGVINSALLGAGGDADHVLVGPWLAVIETKTGYGPVTAVGSTLVAGERTIPGDPVSQAKRQAAAVGRASKQYCDAVVCISDATTPTFVDRGVTVCSLDALPEVIKSLRRRLDPSEAHHILDDLVTLDQKNRR
jgi:hypothetical protein